MNQSWFFRAGKWIDKLGKPAGRWLDKTIDPLTVPGNETSNDWVTDSDWAKLQQEPIRLRLLLRTIALIILLLITWAAFAQLDEVARGEGKVIPSSQMQVIQSFDGGVVADILVREGQVVEKGDLLIKIDPTRFVANFNENRSESFSLMARAARLTALTNNHEMILDEDVVAAAPDIVAHEQKLFMTHRGEINEQIAIAQSQIEQRQQEFQEVSAKYQQASQSYSIANQELTVTRPLLARGAISEVELLRLEGDVVRAKGEQAQAYAQQARLKLAVQEAEGKLREIELNTRNKWRSELSDVLGKISALEQSSTGLADRIKYAELRAPMRGTIQRIYTRTLGGVVQPGRDVMELVPLDDQLLVEAKVSPRDIAFLHPGQSAIVKFTAYDFVIYGGITGKVEHISPDAITDEKDRTYYIVRVRTDRSSFNPALPILPGMMTQVDILTGKKSVLAYIFKPVLRASQNAMTER